MIFFQTLSDSMFTLVIHPPNCVRYLHSPLYSGYHPPWGSEVTRNCAESSQSANGDTRVCRVSHSLALADDRRVGPEMTDPTHTARASRPATAPGGTRPARTSSARTRSTREPGEMSSCASSRCWPSQTKRRPRRRAWPPMPLCLYASSEKRCGVPRSTLRGRGVSGALRQCSPWWSRPWPRPACWPTVMKRLMTQRLMMVVTFGESW